MAPLFQHWVFILLLYGLFSTSLANDIIILNTTSTITAIITTDQSPIMTTSNLYSTTATPTDLSIGEMILQYEVYGWNLLFLLICSMLLICTFSCVFCYFCNKHLEYVSFLSFVRSILFLSIVKASESHEGSNGRRQDQSVNEY